MAVLFSTVSGKGGVGKTLLTASLGITLSRKNRKVLLIDCDMGLRNMDLPLGLENDCFYNIQDLAEGLCLPEDVILPVAEGLDFIPAAVSSWEDIRPGTIETVLEDADAKYDYILLDCPAGIGRGIEFAAKVSDKLLIVIASSWASKRNAEHVFSLYGKKVPCLFIFNQFSMDDPTGISFREMEESADEEYFGGVVPYSSQIDEYAHQGNLIFFDCNTAFGEALDCLDRTLCEDKRFPESRWKRILKRAADEERLYQLERTGEKVTSRGLTWTSGSRAYRHRWRR